MSDKNKNPEKEKACCAFATCIWLLWMAFGVSLYFWHPLNITHSITLFIVSIYIWSIPLYIKDESRSEKLRQIGTAFFLNKKKKFCWGVIVLLFLFCSRFIYFESPDIPLALHDNKIEQLGIGFYNPFESEISSLEKKETDMRKSLAQQMISSEETIFPKKIE